MTTKQCSKCKETKDIKEFNKRKSSKDGLTARCGDCIRAKAMQPVEFEKPNDG